MVVSQFLPPHLLNSAPNPSTLCHILDHTNKPENAAGFCVNLICYRHIGQIHEEVRVI